MVHSGVEGAFILARIRGGGSQEESEGFEREDCLVGLRGRGFFVVGSVVLLHSSDAE